MSDALTASLFSIFLVFCWIGGCMMFAPGFSSPRLPMQIRLLVSVGVTAAVAPLVMTGMMAPLSGMTPVDGVFLIVSETLAGAAIGLMARIFVLALQFAATAVASFIGLAGIPGVPLEETDSGSPLATLASAAAVMLMMHMGLHLELLAAVIDSYSVIPLGSDIPVEALTRNLLATVAETWFLALRLAGPFLLYGVIVNFALGLANRFAQQISAYHASSGAVILGGLMLAYLIWADWMSIFLDAYQSWLQRGGF
jgi:flagellar biosynthetic protein FliR